MTSTSAAEPKRVLLLHSFGLQLSIARTIVEAHGGQISAENLARRGLAFHIRLPLAELPQ
jgi:signal transduction histidine kinase